MTYLVLVVTKAGNVEMTYSCRTRGDADRAMLESMDSDCLTAAVIDTIAGEVIAQHKGSKP